MCGRREPQQFVALPHSGHSPEQLRLLRGRDQQRNVATFVELPFFARLEILNRRILTPPQCQINPRQHEVMDFETHRRTSPPRRACPELVEARQTPSWHRRLSLR